jgi:hypothetical protein
VTVATATLALYLGFTLDPTTMRQHGTDLL